MLVGNPDPVDSILWPIPVNFLYAISPDFNHFSQPLTRMYELSKKLT